jgi:hypothetical protein
MNDRIICRNHVLPSREQTALKAFRFGASRPAAQLFPQAHPIDVAREKPNERATVHRTGTVIALIALANCGNNFPF